MKLFITEMYDSVFTYKTSTSLLFLKTSCEFLLKHFEEETDEVKVCNFVAPRTSLLQQKHSLRVACNVIIVNLCELYCLKVFELELTLLVSFPPNVSKRNLY